MLLNAISTETTMECSQCAQRTLSMVKLKRLVCVLGFGTVTLSAYFIYKYWRLKKLLVKLENHVELLTCKLNSFESEMEEEEEQERIEADTDKHGRLSPTLSVLSFLSSSSSSSDLFPDRCSHDNRKQLALYKKKNKSVSFESDLDKYVTPATSPVPPDDAFEHELKFQFEIIQDVDDNKSLDSYLDASYEELSELSNERQLAYENVSAVVTVVRQIRLDSTVYNRFR
jgi:hypothetical protein